MCNYIFTALPTHSSVLDLLHHLLHRDDSDKLLRMRILKVSVEGGPPSSEIVSGLQVYTAIFKHYGLRKYFKLWGHLKMWPLIYTGVGICVCTVCA